jgi:geranylgeranylglycerol-phosphate geranylgeranyltransferase
VLTLLWFISIFFFLCYAERFPAADEADPGEVNQAIRQEALYVFPFFIIVLVAGVVSTLVGFGGYSFGFPRGFTLILYCLMYFGYGFYLRRLPQEDKYKIRHRLVWPVVLSIGLNLYLGLVFTNLFTSWWPLSPIIAMVVVFAITSRFGKKLFRYFTLTAFGIITVLILLARYRSGGFLPDELSTYFSTLQFCIIVSAYLSVFEAWPIASEIAAEEATDNSNTPSGDLKRSSAYFLATMLALMLSLWALPFFFIFSQYGITFLALFGLHAFVSFLFWSGFVRPRVNSINKWGKRKLWFGVSFLIVLAFTSLPRLAIQPGWIVLPDVVSLDGLGICAFLSGFPIAQLYKSVSGVYEWNKTAFLEPINIVRLLSLLCFIACGVLYLFLGGPSGSKSEFWPRGQSAFYFYGGCIVASLVAELFHDFRKRRSGTIVNTFFAILGLARIVPSLLIALAVFLPGVYRGVNIGTSLLLALPFFLSAVGGYALNDFFDVRKDSIDKPYRAIPSGKLSRDQALSLSITSLLFSVAFSILAAGSWWELLIFFSCIVGVATYNVFVRFWSLSKTVLTALVSSLPILYSSVKFGYPSTFFFLPIAASLFILGREWLMDVRDIEGDRSAGIRTIPMVLGTYRTVLFAFSLQIFGMLLLLPVVIQNPSIWSIGLLCLATSCIILLIPLWFYPNLVSRRRIVQILWAPMLLGILQFVS